MSSPGFCSPSQRSLWQTDPRLNLADLPEYREALTASREGNAVDVTFRDLWEHPESYEGRLVRVRGQVVRRYRQDALGAFPPLTELWITSPDGNLTCLAFPTPPVAAKNRDQPGARVAFTGTFLRLIRYPGSDTDRLAPLIVGSRGPTVRTEAPAPPTAKRKAAWDWIVGGVLAAFVAAILALQHLKRPARRRPTIERAPRFEDADERTDDNVSGNHEADRTSGDHPPSA